MHHLWSSKGAGRQGPLTFIRKNPHHIRNTKDFVEQIHGIQPQHWECFSSYVCTLDTGTYISSHQHQKIGTRSRTILRTSITVEHIIYLLEFCLKMPYFWFQGRFFEQLGAAMVSPNSPIVANLYMETFNIKAINTAEHPPKIWKSYMDDTFVVMKISNTGIS